MHEVQQAVQDAEEEEEAMGRDDSTGGWALVQGAGAGWRACVWWRWRWWLADGAAACLPSCLLLMAALRAPLGKPAASSLHVPATTSV